MNITYDMRLETPLFFEPQDAFNNVLNWLPLRFQDLLSIELTAYRYHTVTHRNWKKLQTKSKFYNFEWSDCHFEANPYKYNYILCRAIEVFIKALNPKIYDRSYSGRIGDNIQHLNVQKIRDKFKGLAARFPNYFGAYIEFKLNIFQGYNAPPNLQESIFAALTGKEEGGDLLLKALFHTIYEPNDTLKSTTRLFIDTCVKKAIPKKATCASYLIFHLVPLKFGDWNKEYTIWIQHLADAAAFTNNDYRAYDLVLLHNEDFRHRMITAGVCNPSVMAHKAAESIDIDSKNLLDEAIEMCRDDTCVPPYIWWWAAYRHQIFENTCPVAIKKTNELYLKALAFKTPPCLESLKHVLERRKKGLILNIDTVKMEDGTVLEGCVLTGEGKGEITSPSGKTWSLPHVNSIKDILEDGESKECFPLLEFLINFWCSVSLAEKSATV